MQDFHFKPRTISHPNSASAEALCFLTPVFCSSALYVMPRTFSWTYARQVRWFNRLKRKHRKHSFYCSFIFVLSNVRITRKDDSSLFNLPFQLGASLRWGGGYEGK